jgi:cytochrome c oxidase subunit 2
MVPSLELLYFSEEVSRKEIKTKVKIIGHQWYWRYESNLFKKGSLLNYDSYIVNLEDLNLGSFRKCEVDKPLVLKCNNSKRLLITSADSIHSWAVPEFGVKVDAIPGRLNQVSFLNNEVGRFYGFCSELCGVKHRFMPIVVEIII